MVFWAKLDLIWAKRDPSGQFVPKVGKSASELGCCNARILQALSEIYVVYVSVYSSHSIKHVFNLDSVNSFVFSYNCNCILSYSQFPQSVLDFCPPHGSNGNKTSCKPLRSSTSARTSTSKLQQATDFTSV